MSDIIIDKALHTWGFLAILYIAKSVMFVVIQLTYTHLMYEIGPASVRPPRHGYDYVVPSSLQVSLQSPTGSALAFLRSEVVNYCLTNLAYTT